MSADRSTTGILNGADFRRRFYTLILLTWMVPPLFGLSFLIYIEIFSVEQMAVVLSTPPKPLFLSLWLVVAFIYFARLARPISAYIDQPTEDNAGKCLKAMQRFTRPYWGLFVIYLLTAPAAMILSAEYYTDYQAVAADWFRVHLVALIVSIIVGLPIYFRTLDLFGLALGDIKLQQPHVTIKAKVFMIGALMPLLVDTMIVQYYWTRTGFFSGETFIIWFTLEVLAIAGSLMFVQSLGQSLAPLQGIIGAPLRLNDINIDTLKPRSTDEIGVLTTAYHTLLSNTQAHNAILKLNNRMLAEEEREGSINDVAQAIVDMCTQTFGADATSILLHNEARNELVGVIQTGSSYNPDGHYHIPMDAIAMSTWAFKHGHTLAIDNVQNDPRVNEAVRARFDAVSAMATPMKLGNKPIGILLISSARQPQHYTDDDIILAEDFAREAALAVHTQRLKEKRLQAEASSREQATRVRLLLDSTVEAIYGADLNGNCTFVNRACLEILGYEHEDDLLGRCIHDLIHHTYADGTPYPKEACTVRLATMDGVIGHADDELHWRADGSSFPVEYWSHPVYENGRLIGSVVTFIDISARKQAEEEFQHLYSRNQLLLESTGEGIIGVDRELRCTFSNQAAAGLLGYTATELLGQDFHQLLQSRQEDGRELPRKESLVLRSIAKDLSLTSDAEVFWHKHGEPIPVQFQASPIHEQDAITGAVVVFRDIAESRAMVQRMDYLATHDTLTGLYNRHEFERRLQQALESAKTQKIEHILCYLDLDQFKVVNDTCGHVAGDELLRQVTTLLSRKVRQTDALARLGGDEFGVLFNSCPLHKALELVEELRHTVEDFRFTWENKSFSVGVSIGVVPINADTENLAHALSAADSACYVAKDRGRNRIHIYEVTDEDLSLRHGEMQWVSRINDALSHNRFQLRFQSIAPCGQPQDLHRFFEVLLIMRSEDGQIIPPGAFIPAAERYNLMTSVDRWVIRETFAWLHENREQLTGVEHCSINLSGHSINQDDFLGFIREQMQRHAINPGQICFEITETAAVANLTRASAFINELRAEGCHFALDDFGSGMSSFAYLKNLPVDFLKIDGNFVRDMANDPIDRAMVEAIHQVGHVMGLKTIAEFVEDDAILQHLQRIGVDYAQGYGIAKPKLMKEFFSESL